MPKPIDPLVAAIDLLARNVAAQTEWLKVHVNVVTRKDLAALEERLGRKIDNIGTRNISAELAASVARLGTAIDNFDALIPDKV